MSNTNNIIIGLLLGSIIGTVAKDHYEAEFQKNSPSFAYKTAVMPFKTKDSKKIHLNAEFVLSSQNPKCLQEVKNRTYWSMNDAITKANYQDFASKSVKTNTLLPISDINFRMSNMKENSLGPDVCAIKKITALTYAPG